MEKSAKSLSYQDIFETIESWVISLSQVAKEISENLNFTLVCDIPLEALPLIQKYKTIPDEAEIDRFDEVENYLTNTSSLRNNSQIQTLQESNWKTYLVFWKDDIFEVKSSKWPIYIAYHPIRQKYIVYKYFWQNSDENTSILWWLDKIEKTSVEWYYYVSTSTEKIYWYSVSPNEDEEEIVTEEVSYLYIWDNWESKHFWNYISVWYIYKYWNIIYFQWEGTRYNPELVLYNWEKTLTIPAWIRIIRKSKSGRNFLHMFYDSPLENTKYTLFDLDNFQFIFERADSFWFSLSFPDNWVWIFDNEISWEFYEQRKWFLKILWDKVIKHTAVL